MRFSRIRFAVPRGVNGLENEIGYTRHGRHHHHAIPVGRLGHDFSTLAKAPCVPHRRSAKLHDDQALAVHSVLPDICSPTLPVIGRYTSVKLRPADPSEAPVRG